MSQNQIVDIYIYIYKYFNLAEYIVITQYTCIIVKLLIPDSVTLQTLDLSNVDSVVDIAAL